ncbi:MAG: hypothetical protein ACXVCX_10340 [Ktedonobacterales bacterium]
MSLEFRMGFWQAAIHDLAGLAGLADLVAGIIAGGRLRANGASDLAVFFAG